MVAHDDPGTFQTPGPGDQKKLVLQKSIIFLFNYIYLYIQVQSKTTDLFKVLTHSSYKKRRFANSSSFSTSVPLVMGLFLQELGSEITTH